MNKIYVSTPTGHLRATTRLTKLTDVLQSMGMEINHLAWIREPDEPANDPGINTIPVLTGGGYKTTGLAKWYLRYMWANMKAMSKLPYGSHVYALSFWSAFPAALVAKRRGLKYIFDNNDNISLAYNWPASVKGVVQKMEAFTVKRAALHLVPGHARWRHNDANLRVIPNVPSAQAVEEAINISRAHKWTKQGPLTVYVNGWLPTERGLAPITNALKRLKDTNIRVLLAGRVDAPEGHVGRELATLPMVTDLGKLSNAEALAHYHESHLVLTYYDPAIPINRLAEANKWGDCLLTQTAILVNDEVETGEPYRKVKGTYGTPYNDDQALADLLRKLADNPQEAIETGKNLSQIQTAPWDLMMTRLVSELLDQKRL